MAVMIACSRRNEEGPQLKDVERSVNNLGKLSDEHKQRRATQCVLCMHIYRKCKPSSAHHFQSACLNGMELVGLLSLTALCLMSARAKADVSEHYLPPGSRPPSSQYLPPGNRPPPPVQFPAGGSQPPSFEDPESVVIEADPFGRDLTNLNFQRGSPSGAFFRSADNQRGQQIAPQRNYNQNPPLNYFPRSSPSYSSLVENGLTSTSSSGAFLNRNSPPNGYVTTPLPSLSQPVQSLLDQQRLRTHGGYPAFRPSSNHQQNGYSYQAPRVPFSLPRQDYKNSHVNLGVHQQLSARSTDFLVSELNLNPRGGYADHNVNHYNYHANAYQSNGQQQRNQRVGYSY